MSEKYPDAEKQVLVVRVPEVSEPVKDLRDYIVSSLQLGVLILPPGASYKLEEFPDLGGVKIFGAVTDAPNLVQPGALLRESACGKSGDGAEKRAILDRMRRYRTEYGAGCFAEVARKCGKGITEEMLRDMLIGNVVLPITEWRKVARALDKLGWEVHPEAPVNG